MNVSELTGARLDFWVARAAAIDVIQNNTGLPDEWIGRLVDGHQERYSPSSEWAQAGALIECEQISIERAFRQPGEPLRYYARAGTGLRRTRSLFGPTHLVAAMRAYVDSAFGDRVPPSQ